jgi:IclR family KDG regulon transcriptional repressor
MVRREKANYLIQSVSHAIDVLEELSKAGGEVGVTELSKRLKLHKNNVFRLLATLELRGYVEQNPETEDYRLGVRCLEMGQSYLSQSELVKRAMPVLKELNLNIGETVSLAVLRNSRIHYPVSLEAKRPVKVASRNNTSFAAKHCATGRLLTAQLQDSVLEEVLSENTPQDAAIKNQLTELRKSGMIIDKGAIEADVVLISFLVRDYINNVAGAIEVLVPQYRADVEATTKQVKAAAEKLSGVLGSVKGGLASALEKEITRETISSGLTGSLATASA